MSYRRFGYLFSRVLLARQDELSVMESELNGMDKQDADEGNELYIKSHSQDAIREGVPQTWPCSRTEMMDKLEVKLTQYGLSDMLILKRNFAKTSSS